ANLTSTIRLSSRPLLDRIAAGEIAPSLDETALVTVEDTIATKLKIAKAALARLEADAAKAGDLLTLRRHGIERCALAELVDRAVDEANTIVAAEAGAPPTPG